MSLRVGYSSYSRTREVLVVLVVVVCFLLWVDVKVFQESGIPSSIVRARSLLLFL